jgi:hypothetical protein
MWENNRRFWSACTAVIALVAAVIVWGHSTLMTVFYFGLAIVAAARAAVSEQ